MLYMWSVYISNNKGKMYKPNLFILNNQERRNRGQGKLHLW